MSQEDDANEFASKVLTTMGPTETLLMAMRLALLVAQRSGEDPAVAQATKDAIAAIKRVGALTGAFPSSEA